MSTTTSIEEDLVLHAKELNKKVDRDIDILKSSFQKMINLVKVLLFKAPNL